jgi:hypothetical protein
MKYGTVKIRVSEFGTEEGEEISRYSVLTISGTCILQSNPISGRIS